jgi:hypothetical protein
MKIQRAIKPEMALLLLPWYVEVNRTREMIGWELNERMAKQPDDTLVLVAMDNQEKHILGFSACYVRYNDVFIWQARNEKLSRSEVDEVLNSICKWAKSKGFSRIAAMPNRNPKLWKRRWGFSATINNEVVKEI